MLRDFSLVPRAMTRKRLERFRRIAAHFRFGRKNWHIRTTEPRLYGAGPEEEGDESTTNGALALCRGGADPNDLWLPLVFRYST